MKSLASRALVRAVLALSLLLVAAPAARAQDPQVFFFKVFLPDTIGPGSVSTLLFEISSSEAVPVTGLAFTDTLPAGVTIANPPNASTTCGGDTVFVDAPAGGSTITFTGGELPPTPPEEEGVSCLVLVDVTSATPGDHANVSGDLTSSLGNHGNAIADLTVDDQRPGFTKGFAPNPITVGQTSTLTFTIDNSANGSLAVALAFSDPLPPGMEIASPADAATTCDGVLTANPGATSISFSNGSVGPGSTCTVSVDVLATAAGSLGNTSGELTSGIFPAVSSGKAAAVLEVQLEAFHKLFLDDPAPPGGTVTLRFTITNFDRNEAATDIAFTDDLDAALSGLAAISPLPADPCGPGSTLTGTSTLSLSGGSLPAGGSCTFDVTLQVPAGATPGTHTNTTEPLTANVGGTPVTLNAATDDLVIAPAPILTKTVTPDPALAGDELTVEFLLENPSSDAMIEISFLDDFESFIPGSTVTPLADGYCNGTGTSATSATQIEFDSIELAAGASCTFSFTLQVPLDAASRLYINTTSEVTGTGVDMTPVTGRAGSDDVTIIAAPFLDKTFLDPVPPGATVTLEFTLTSPEAATDTAIDIAFTDDLTTVLAGLTAIDTPITDVCGAGSLISGTTVLTFTGGSLEPNSSCTFSVTFQVPAGAAPGSYPNTTSEVTATTNGEAVSSAPATDDLDVSGLRLTKRFTDDPAVAGGTVTLELVLRNDDPSFAATDIAFTDDLSAALAGLAYNGPALMDVCGAGSQLTGTSTLSFTGGSLAPGTSCTIPLVLDVPAGAAAGEYFNTTSQVTATVDGSPVVVAGGSDALTIVDPLTIEKEFTDDPVAAGGTVTLAFTLTNAHPTEPVTGVTFSDDLEAALSGLTAVDTPVLGCGGTLTGTSLLTFLGGTVPAAGSCTITVTLQVPATVASGTMATNTTSSVTGTLDGVGVTGAPASDVLLVEIVVLTKAFDGPTTATGTAVLTFTIENLSATETLSGLSFSDDLNAALPGLVATGLPASGVCGAGSQISGTGFLTFTGGTLDPETSCTFDVTVQVPAGAAPGSHTNTTSDLTASGLVVSTPASADLEIEPPPTFAKSFAPAVTGVGVASTLTFTIDNTASALAATGLAFTDNLPAGVTVATPANASTTCTGGTITATPGAGTVSYTGGTVAAGATCTVQADVVAASAGSFVNVSGEFTSSSGSSGTASSTLTVRSAPTVTKAFTPDVIVMGGTSTVTVTIDNSANVTDATAVTFMDALPAGVVVVPTPNASTTCTGGTITASPGAGSFSYNGGTAPGGTSCQVSVDVTAAAAGSYDNSVTVSSSLGTSAPASDTLEVAGTPAVSKAFSPTEVALGGTVTVIVTIDNSANPLPATGLSFTDMLPAGLVVADPSGATTDCTGGTLDAVPGASQFSYSGGTVAAGDVCAVLVDVTTNDFGVLENVLVVDSSLGQSPEASAVLRVEASLADIPTAGTWGLLALGLLLATGALWRLRF